MGFTSNIPTFCILGPCNPIVEELNETLGRYATANKYKLLQKPTF
jgi:hypothetical protein